MRALISAKLGSFLKSFAMFVVVSLGVAGIVGIILAFEWLFRPSSGSTASLDLGEWLAFTWKAPLVILAAILFSVLWCVVWLISAIAFAVLPAVIAGTIFGVLATIVRGFRFASLILLPLSGLAGYVGAKAGIGGWGTTTALVGYLGPVVGLVTCIILLYVPPIRSFWDESI